MPFFEIEPYHWVIQLWYLTVSWDDTVRRRTVSPTVSPGDTVHDTVGEDDSEENNEKIPSTVSPTVSPRDTVGDTNNKLNINRILLKGCIRFRSYPQKIIFFIDFRPFNFFRDKMDAKEKKVAGMGVSVPNRWCLICSTSSGNEKDTKIYIFSLV